MKKKAKLAGVATIAFLFAGCQNTENIATDENIEPVKEESQGENTSSDEEVQETKENNDQNSPTHEKESAEDNADVYGETQATPNYFIDTHTYSTKTDFLTAFSIEREENQDFSPAERLKTSLIENDPTAQGILDSLSEITVDWPTLYINFNVEDPQLSTTSAISGLFYDSLFGISDLYGIEEIVFSNPDGERNITVAERLVDAPIVIEDERERGLSRGYYTIYDTDLEETLFLSGGELEEPVATDNGEPFTFPETLEAMSAVEKEDAFYASAIVEGLEIGSASLKNGVATVQYTMDEEIITEADRIVFDRAIQLAALDFHAREVRLINDTLQEISMYPLVGQ